MTFIRNHKGGISIFQCIIFSAFFLLVGVFVDMGRIMLAEKKVESALNASLRSALADYHPNLAGEYGIFGRDTLLDQKSLENTFQMYMKMNLLEKEPGFQFIRYQTLTGEKGWKIEGRGSLLAGEDFRNQILENMKYKAPVLMVQEVLSKFSASGISRKLNFSKAEKEVRKKQEKVKLRLKTVNENTSRVESSYRNQDAGGLKKCIGDLEKAREENLEIEKDLQAYLVEKEKADRIAGEKEADETVFAGSEIVKSSSGFEKVSAESKALGESIQRNLGALSSAAGELESLETRISDLEEEKKDKKTTKERKEEIEKTLEELQSKAEGIKSGLSLEEMQTLEAEEAQGEEETQDEETREETGGFLEKLKNEWGKYLKNMDPAWMITEEDYSQAAQDIMDLQGMKITSEVYESKNDSILDYMTEVVDAVKNFAKGGMEKSFLVEYVMENCTYATSEAKNGHYFEKGEAEYVLWGSPNQLKNMGETMAGIWLLRFAIDTLDSFATSTVPVPFLRLLSALIQGFTQSCGDMVALYQGKEVSLCPSLKKSITLNYGDHLRIFLMMKAITRKGESTLLNRMRQLIQNNLMQGEEDFRLVNQKTGLVARVEVRANLWFLPFLPLEKLGLSRFRKGGYVVVKEAYDGY